MSTNTPCTLCGSTDTRLLFTKQDIPTYHCESCSFIFCRADQNANFQDSFSDYELSYQQYLQSSPTDIANHARTLKWIESFVKLDSNIKCLEVGSGSGKFLRYLREHRPSQFLGLEPSPGLYKSFHSQDPNVRFETLPEFAKNNPHSVDVVLILDVIEHIDDLKTFGNALVQVMKPGAYLFISTPKVDAWVARALGKRWHHFNKYHLSLFKRSTLKQFGQNLGFQVLDCRPRGKMISANYLFNYLVEFVIGKKLAKPIPVPNIVFPLDIRDIQYCTMQAVKTTSHQLQSGTSPDS